SPCLLRLSSKGRASVGRGGAVGLTLCPATAGRFLVGPAGATDHRALGRRSSPAAQRLAAPECPTASLSTLGPRPRPRPLLPLPETMPHGAPEAFYDRQVPPRLGIPTAAWWSGSKINSQ